MRKWIEWIGRCLFALRYRIEVDDRDLQEKGRKKKILFLPNHSAQVDPLLVFSRLFHRYFPRPLVTERFYYLPGLRFFMRLVRALPVPDFRLSANQWKVHQVSECLRQVKEGLERGENFLVYPSGMLKQEGHEMIGGNSFVHRILESCPDAQIVLIRTTGLWGSTFSRALTGISPNFWEMFKRGVIALLKSGIFFLPKRNVHMTFVVDPEDFPRRGTKGEINEYLENWYNRYEDGKGGITDSEPLSLVRLNGFSKELPKVEWKQMHLEKNIEVREEIRRPIIEKLAQLAEISMEEIGEKDHLIRDLNLDSLDIADIQVFLDQTFGIERFVPEEMQTVGELFALAAEKERRASQEDFVFAWPEEKRRRKEIGFPRGKTLQEVFLASTKRMGKVIACADESLGSISYEKMRIAALALAPIMRKWKGEYIGVLLPSSVTVYIVTQALLLAGKVPVMLNWTMGERGLEFSKKLLHLEVVVTARRFLERLDVLELGSLEKNLVLMEDIRGEINSWRRLVAWIHSKTPVNCMLSSLRLKRVDAKKVAIVLFTSGTETDPKAVPLSHANLLGNQRAIFESIQLKESDCLYAALPPFHSFGFSVTGTLPLFVGMKVFYSPDPTDSHRMIMELRQSQPTMICLAPSFYRRLFAIGHPKDFASIRLFVSGAESATPDLFAFVESLPPLRDTGNRPKMIEGYGITECSPVVTINRVENPPCGVGTPLPGVNLRIVHPDTLDPIDNDETLGEVCIQGVNVFAGYLGTSVPSPFVEIDGSQWYRSGDLGRIVEDGALLLAGRLKRFVKIGGEMVSLASLEKEIVSRGEEEGIFAKGVLEPQVAIGVHHPREEEKPILVLFTTVPLSREKVNLWLREGGFGRIIKIAVTKHLLEIPMTGTGKVHDRRIKEMSASLVI